MILYLVSVITVCSAASLKTPPVASAAVEFEKRIPDEAPIASKLPISYDYAIDLSVGAMINDMSCLKSAHYQYVFVRAYASTGDGYFDPYSVTILKTAYSVGLGIEVYMTPQPKSTKQGYQQVDETYQGLTSRGIIVRSIWIQVTSPANWLGNANNNIVFINSMVSRAKQYGIQVGIYTNFYDWNQITNGWLNVGLDVQLWYWDVYGVGANGETEPTFDDFRSFASWTAPTIKQFAQYETVCHISPVNRNVVYNPAGMKLERLDKPVVGSIGI